MSFSFGSATTTAGSTFGTTTPSTGFAFGSGEPAKQGLFGAGSTDNKPAFNFSSPSGGGFAFGAAKTTAPTSSIFSTPTTSAAPAFGASKPVSFGGFTSPPNQTVGSPGFGLQSGGSLVGGNTQQPAPAFGTPTTQASTGFGSSPSTGFGFGQSPQPSTGFGQSPQPSTGFGTQPATTGFGTQPTGTGFGSTPSTGFGAAQPSTGFGSQPATSGFGFSTPATGFSAPQPNQQQQQATTTATAQPTQSFLGGGTTSGFGQNALRSKPGSAFSFGGGTTTAPALGGASTTTTTQGGFGQKPATLGFGTLGAATSTPQTGLGQTGLTGQATGLTGQATGLTGQATGLTGQATGLGGQTTGLTTAPSFGAAQTATSTPQGFGSFTSPTPLSFGGNQQTSQPATGLSFAPPSTAQPTLGFGTPTTTQTGQTGLSFGAPTTTQTGLSFGTQPATSGVATSGTDKPLLLGQALPAGQFPKTSAPLSFGPVSTGAVSATSTAPVSSGLTSWSTPASTATSQPATGLSFGTSTAASKLSFGAVSTSAPNATIDSSFGKPITSVVGSSAASTTAPSGIIALGKTTATTALASLSTATTTTASAPVPPQTITSITFAQLEESINKWTLELEEQENVFINQATQINAWDRLLIANGEKIVELNDAVQSVKNEQQSLEHELDFVLAQQKELEDLLAPMEKQLSEETVDRLRDPEREHMYSLAENLDTQLRQMSEDLKEVIEHLNETNRSQDSNDPIVQIGRILNAHMSSMQWIDNSIAQISTKLDQLKATHDTLRRDNERSYQLTYN
nr:nuclear pore glycoprotein p62 isoform X2 [Helicoverpa armigera]